MADPLSSTSVKLSSLRAMAQAGLKEVPGNWIEQLTKILARHDGELTVQAVATARALASSPGKGESLVPPLLTMAEDTRAPSDLRLAALSAVAANLPQIGPGLFSFLLSQLDREQPAPIRTAAADVLARAKLTTSQLDALADVLKTAGPLEVDRLMTAFDQSSDESIGLKLVKVLGESSALSSLRADAVKQHLAKFGSPVQTAALRLYSQLNADAAKQKVRIDELMSSTSSGDVRRGQLIFHSEKAACYACHAIGYRGGNIGPDLTKVGQIRAERDLLEAIVYPSASLIRSFEPVIVATADGKVLNGLLKNETSDEILLVTGANQEARLSRADIEEIRPGTVSIMPAGLDQQLTNQELADLVAFLKACR
jgi:putative heme-binding domain-containing protein